MANYEQLKASIIAAIYNNGNQEITGEVLQSVLLSIVNIIGANATFSGVATPTTAPGTSDQLVFYIAGQPGTYANFGAAKLNNGELAVFSNPNGAWKTEKIYISRSYDAEKILALTTSSSSDDIKAAFTPIGGSEVDFPKVGDYIISQSQQSPKAKPNSVVTESTETILKGKRIAFLANGINYAITIVFFIGGTYMISSIATAEIGADTDIANASGSVYGRIAKNAEDVKALQDEPSLHDLWLNAGATYQAETDTYTLNGLAGLTKSDMLTAWRETSNMILIGNNAWRYQQISFKTNFLAKKSYEGQPVWADVTQNDFTRAFYFTDSIEVLKVSGNVEYARCCPYKATDMFNACPVVTIKGIIEMSKCIDAAGMFFNASRLELVKLRGVKQSISFISSLNLTVSDDEDSTLGYLVTNASNESPITITLHADAFARVPETLIQKAQAKQISIVSA